MSRLVRGVVKLVFIGRYRAVGFRPQLSACIAAAIAWMAIAGIGSSPPTATAAPIFFGPTPYLSSADSPFDLSGLGTTMFLEDFEDGELNTPGVFQLGIPEVRGAVVGPSAFTDSVDADDGTIDGSGLGGHSFAATQVITALTFPPRHHWQVWFHFDDATLGFYPTAVGFVWTDGVPMSAMWLNSWDGRGVELPRFIVSTDNIFVGTLGDARLDGTTADDRFFGIVNPGGISRVLISSTNTGDTLPFEMDHLQYGLYVPEGGSLGLGALALAMLLIISFRVRFS